MKRVGRFQLTARDRDTIQAAFKRTDEPLLNIGPSASQKGRKIAKGTKQRLNLWGDELEKEAVDWGKVGGKALQYGLPALIGGSIGGALDGWRGGLIGTGVGAGVGHAVPYIGKGVGSLFGSSAAQGPAPDPSSSAPVLAQNPAGPEKTWLDHLVDISQDPDLTPGERRNAERLWTQEKSYDSDYKNGGTADPSRSFAYNTLSAIPGVGGLFDLYSGYTAPTAGDRALGYTAGISQLGLEGLSLAQHLGQAAGKGGSWLSQLGNAGKGLFAAQATPFLGAIGKMPSLAQAIPGEILKFQTIMDLAGIINDARSAPTDPNKHWAARAVQALGLSGQAYGRRVLDDVYEGVNGLPWYGKALRMGGSMTAAPVAATTQWADTGDALSTARKTMATSGQLVDPKLIENQAQREQAIRLQYKLEQAERAAGRHNGFGNLWGWNPATWVLGGYGSLDPRDGDAALENTGRWYGL